MARHVLGLSLPLFPLLALACFSANSPGPDDSGEASVPDAQKPDSASPEAMTDASPDATLDAPAEAPALDAPPEVEAAMDAPADVPPAPVTVTVLTWSGAPEPGVLVVFDDDLGNYLSSATTDATGTVVQQLAPGSQVTALFGSPAAQVGLMTWTAVEPGDALTAIDATAAVMPQVSVPVASLPTPLPNSTGYYDVIAGPCSSGAYNVASGPAYFPLQPGCASGGQFPLLVEAEDSTGSNVLGFTFQNGNMLTADGGVPSFTFSGATWQPMGTAQILAINGGASHVNGALSEVAGGVPLTRPFGLTAAGDGGTGLVATYPTHPGYPDFVQAEVNQGQNVSCISSVEALATRPASFTGTATFDLSQFPGPVAGTLDTSASTTQPTIGLSGTLGAGSLAQLPFTGTLDGAAQNGVWTFVVPPGTTSFTAPAMPAAAAAWVPAGTPNFGQGSGVPTVATVEGPGVTYAGIKRIAGTFGAQVLQRTYGAVVPPLPFVGTVRLSLSSPNAC